MNLLWAEADFNMVICFFSTTLVPEELILTGGLEPLAARLPVDTGV